MGKISPGIVSLVLACRILGCSSSQLVWEPEDSNAPPFYPVGGAAEVSWIGRSGKKVAPPPRKNEDHNSLLPFSANGRYGYRRDGNTVIAPELLYAEPFYEGRAVVVRQGPCRPVDAGFCGAPFVLPTDAMPKGVSPLDRALNRGAARFPACRYTYVDESGVAAGAGGFDEARAFHEGLAAVRVGLLWGYVDRSLNIKIQPQYKQAYAFSGGLAAVSSDRGFYYIDQAGNTRIKGPFDAAGMFHEGVAVVRVGERDQYIDAHGRKAVPGKFLHGGRFFHGLANVRMGNGRMAYIDRKGRAVYRWSDTR